MRRVLACLKACRGMSTEMLERTSDARTEIAYRFIIAQRDWLYAGLDALLIRFGVADVPQWDEARHIRDTIKNGDIFLQRLVESRNELNDRCRALEQRLKRSAYTDSEYATTVHDLSIIARQALATAAALRAELADGIEVTGELSTMIERLNRQLALCVETCDNGHVFLPMTDHPRRDNKYRCPHCLAQGFDWMKATDTVNFRCVVPPREPLQRGELPYINEDQNDN